MAMSTQRANYVNNLRKELRMLRVDTSLLVLARALSVSRGEVNDPIAAEYLAQLGQPLPPFAIHLIAKFILRYGRRNTPKSLNWPQLLKVLPMAIQLAIDDPVVDSSDDEVGSMLIRIMSQQASHAIHLQCYGLAIGLFQDLDSESVRGSFDVRAELELVLGMPIEHFMRLAVVAMSGCAATLEGLPQPGTLNDEFLTKLSCTIPGIPWEERWESFAQIVSCNQVEFNRLDQEICTSLQCEEFHPYAFNPLHAKPLVDIGEGRYICVDNRLLWQRTGLGLFHDAFTRSKGTFSGQFGHAFEKFVGDLLRTSIPNESLWNDYESPRVKMWQAHNGKHHKLADLIYTSPSRNVFMECKSARPTLGLVANARVADLKEFARRMAKAVQQLVGHSDAVERGEWVDEHLHHRPSIMVVVTLGRIETINGPFFRNFINAELKELGVPVPCYAILSLEELDSVIWLTECGKDFGEVMKSIASEPSFDPLQNFPELTERAASSFAESKTQRMWDFLPQNAELK